jgi:hypothetical protein
MSYCPPRNRRCQRYYVTQGRSLCDHRQSQRQTGETFAAGQAPAPHLSGDRECGATELGEPQRPQRFDSPYAGEGACATGSAACRGRNRRFIVWRQTR